MPGLDQSGGHVRPILQLDVRDVPPEARDIFLRHHGLYCFRRDVLLQFPTLPSPQIESTEKLEQLRLLWHGYRIKVRVVDPVAKGVDTMEDYRDFLARIRG